MNNTDNKELLLAAIEDYDQFNKSQKTLINISLEFRNQDGITPISVKSLVELTGVTKTMIYQNLVKLQKAAVLTISSDKKRQKIKEIELNKVKLQEIIDTYLKKQKILQKNYTK